VPVCPVDCISLENASGERTGWAAWSEAQAQQALARYEWHRERGERAQREQHERLERKAQAKLADLPAHTHGARRQGALARARGRTAQAAIIEARSASARCCIEAAISWRALHTAREIGRAKQVGASIQGSDQPPPRRSPAR
jgi:hypothetical protein